MIINYLNEEENRNTVKESMWLKMEFADDKMFIHKQQMERGTQTRMKINQQWVPLKCLETTNQLDQENA